MNLLSGVEQDFHRPQRTPGAYEWWHFDGTDDTSGLCFSAQFYAGHLLSPYYQESLARYWKETRSPLVAGGGPPRPPNPLDYTGVAFRVFKGGDLLGEFLQEFDPGMLKASEREPALLLGSNRFNWIPDGDPPSYALTLQGKVERGLSLRARLFFTPRELEVPLPPASETLPSHTWVLAAPLCHVEGTFEWCDAEGAVKKERKFVGRGYHDHHYGSVPLDRFVSAWHWGRAFLGEETLVYSMRLPRDEKEPPEGFLLAGSPSGTKARRVSFGLSQARRNFFWVPYHKGLGSTDVQDLRISHRRVLSDGPVSLLFGDEVEWAGNGPALKGGGMSNYLYTPRLSSRFFFPMLKGKTVKVARAALSGPGTLDQPGGDVFTDRPDIPLK
jgi:carotenoid 1,2-hydratase